MAATVKRLRTGLLLAAALLLAVAATLVLGIVPNEVLRAADAGAHTLQALPAQTEIHGAVIEQLPNP